MSSHCVKVVEIPSIQKHPNADSLGLVEVEGYNVIVRLDAWTPGQLAVFVEPDYVVPETEQFAFLGGHRRIKTKRLRGVWSMGLLIPAPEGASAGDDVMEQLGIERYEPEIHAKGHRNFVVPADTAPAPDLAAPPAKYDLENLRKAWDCFTEGERVVVTEKIHGANARYVFDGEKMHLGSRTRWVKDDGVNVWSKALQACPWIEQSCRNSPWTVLFGEVFGRVQDLHYGRADSVDFRVFDFWFGGSFDPRFCSAATLHTTSNFVTADHLVPVVYSGPFNKEKLLELAEGMSLVPGADHLREGIVVKPGFERWDAAWGRVAFKLVSNAYLAR